MINWIGKKAHKLRELEETFSEGLSYLQEICRHIFQENEMLFDFTVDSFLWLSDTRAVRLFVDSCPHYDVKYVVDGYEFDVQAKKEEKALSFDAILAGVGIYDIAGNSISRVIRVKNTKLTEPEWITLWQDEEVLSND